MRRAFTLAEIIAALAVMGFAMALVGLSLRPRGPHPGDGIVTGLRAARAEAVREGRPVAWGDGSDTIRFQADGSASPTRVVRDSITVVVDRLTGDAHVLRR